MAAEAGGALFWSDNNGRWKLTNKVVLLASLDSLNRLRQLNQPTEL